MYETGCFVCFGTSYYASSCCKIRKRIPDCHDRGRLKNWTFLGQPGTGKTTVARKMAVLLRSFGLLPTDNFVETSALDLTGEFVGQSKSKMQEEMDEARGGVLFNDEAYELGVGSYGNEVMTKLVQLLTDERYEVGPLGPMLLRIPVKRFVFFSLFFCTFVHARVL
jgi:hypothetical protein